MAVRLQSRLPARERKQQILEVATRLFAAQGYRGTTTREIAEAARVNEAIIFRHFPTKEDLYWGVIDEKCRHGRSRQDFERRVRETNSSRELFIALAHDILHRHDDPTLSRLLLFSALENHDLSGRFFRTYTVKYYESLAAYISERIKAGEFRETDPLLAARSFLGMVFYHFLVQELFRGKRYQKFDRAKVCEALADLWLNGMCNQRGLNGRGHSVRGNGMAGKK